MQILAELPGAVGNSLLRCLYGFGASVLVGVPLGVLVALWAPLRVTLRPLLAAVQSLPAACLVPMAVVVLGESESAVYAVVLLGAVPSLAVGVAGALDQVPPLLLRAGESLGSAGLHRVVRLLAPAALPGLVAAVRQGWTFGWRALMTAELITSVPLPGVGAILDEGKRNDDPVLVFTAAGAILAIGLLVEWLVFAPWERRVLRARGLGAMPSPRPAAAGVGTRPACATDPPAPVPQGSAPDTGRATQAPARHERRIGPRS
ncbi:ABC transporter permease subunit [Streptomyces flavidovirens]|uniref:ABC transporter permease n=1 Tax=Streptomyces flavidovirens TaxID=67298 RepID=UPI003421EDA1